MLYLEEVSLKNNKIILYVLVNILFIFIITSCLSQSKFRNTIISNINNTIIEGIEVVITDYQDNYGIGKNKYSNNRSEITFSIFVDINGRNINEENALSRSISRKVNMPYNTEEEKEKALERIKLQSRIIEIQNAYLEALENQREIHNRNRAALTAKYRNAPEIWLQNVFLGKIKLNIGQIYRIVDFNNTETQILDRPFDNDLFIVNIHHAVIQDYSHSHINIIEQVLIHYNKELFSMYGNQVNVLKFMGTTSATTQGGFHKEILTFSVPE